MARLIITLLIIFTGVSLYTTPFTHHELVRFLGLALTAGLFRFLLYFRLCVIILNITKSFQHRTELTCYSINYDKRT